MADSPSEQSRPPPNHHQLTRERQDVTSRSSRVTFMAARLLENEAEMRSNRETPSISSPSPPKPSAPLLTAVPHPPTSSADRAMPHNGVVEALEVGFDSPRPYKSAEEVGGIDFHQRTKIEHTCLPILNCNADGEDAGGIIERNIKLPSTEKESKPNQNEVSNFLAYYFT